MIQRSVVVFILLVFLNAVLGAQSAAAPPSAANREIAAGLLAQARLAYGEGRREQAAGLLEASLEFDPQSSESAYLSALLLLAEQEGSHRAVPYLRQALDAGTWVDTDPFQAVAALAGFYTRSRRFAEARRLLESLERTAAPAALGSRCTAALAATWARVLLGQGEAAAAEVFLRRALERFPQSADLYLLAGRQLAARGRVSDAAEMLRRAERALPEHPAPVLALAGLERAAAARIQLVDRYLAKGGSDPGAPLLALRAAPKDPLRYFEAFLRLGGEGQLLHLEELQELARRRRQEAEPRGAPPGWGQIASRLAESARRYSGARRLDADGDGLYEELYQYYEGTLRSWSLDADQDGSPEVRAEFIGGLPALITVHGERTVELSYSAYPALAERSFRDEAGRRTYSLFPYRLQAPAFGAPPAGAAAQGPEVSAETPPLRLRFRGGLPTDEASVRRQSYELREYDAAAGGAPGRGRRCHLLEGAVTRVEQDPDSRGRYRHVVHYDRSGPVEGRRDEDGDGRFEMREEYAAGALLRVLLDADGDGVEEFAQSFAPGRLSWDYDADGRYDSVEYQSPEGETVREFSSRLDGRFDLKAVFRSGRILRFLRDGRALPVSYDERRGLYWIGRRLEESIPVEGLEGIQRRDGRTLFGLRYMGRLYVGELP